MIYNINVISIFLEKLFLRSTFMKNQINVQHIKNFFSKPTVLILVITMAIPVLLSTIISIATYNEVSKVLETIYTLFSNELAQNFDTSDFMTTNAISSFISTFTSFIFSLIPICVWLWIFISAKNKDINKTPDTPLLINMVLSILGIVSSSLCVLIVGMFSIIFIPITLIDLPYESQQDQDIFSSFFIILMVIFTVLLILSIIQLLYYIGKTMFFNSVRKCMTRDRIKPTGKLYGIFAFVEAFLYIIIGAIIIIFGIVLLLNDGYVNFNTDFSVNDFISALSLFKGFSLLILLSGVTMIIRAISLLIEGKIAFNYFKMAKEVPPTPNFNPYNNYNRYNNSPYYQNNCYNQVNPNYNNPNYCNPNYNNPNFNQGYVTQQEQPQQPVQQQNQTQPNDYMDDFNNLLNDDDLNINPYENK